MGCSVESKQLLTILFKKAKKVVEYRPVLVRTALAMTLGLSIHLFYPSGSLSFVAILCYFGWFATLSNSTARQGLVIGLVFGFSFFIGLGPGLLNALDILLNFGPLKSVLFTIFLAILHSAPYGLAGLLLSVQTERIRKPGFLISAVILTSLQTLPNFLLPILPAHFLYDCPFAIQIVDLGGLPLLMFVLNLAGFLTIHILSAVSEKRTFKSSLAILLILLVSVSTYGFLRLRQLDEDEARATPDSFVQIAAIQPNIPVYKWDKPVFVEEPDTSNNLETAIGLSEEAVRDHPFVDLLVWPEMPLLIYCDKPGKEFRTIKNSVKKMGVPLLFMCEQDLSKNKLLQFYNTAAITDNNGDIVNIYNKMKLLPFGEYLPFENIFPRLRRLFKHSRYYIPGNEPVTFSFSKNKTIIPAICYEGLFASHVGSFNTNGDSILINMSDEAYFGKTKASLIALSLTVFRSVEFRIPLLRVTNSGNGCAVRASGRIVPGSQTPLFKTATRIQRLHLHSSISFFGAIHSYSKLLLFLAFLVSLMVYLSPGLSIFYSSKKDQNSIM